MSAFLAYSSTCLPFSFDTVDARVSGFLIYASMFPEDMSAPSPSDSIFVNVVVETFVGAPFALVVFSKLSSSPLSFFSDDDMFAFS